MPIRNASNLVASTQLTGGGAGGRLLWKWNESDVSQFGDGDGTPTSTSTGSDLNGTLSVATLSGGSSDVTGPVLKYTHTGTAGDEAQYVINDLPDSMPERYVIRAHLGPREGTSYGQGTMPAILLAYQDSTHLMKISANGARTSLLVTTGNGSTSTGGDQCFAGVISNSYLQDDSGLFIDIYCAIKEPDTGVDPEMIFVGRPIMPGTPLVVRANRSGTWTADGATCPTTSWDAGWQTGGTCRQPGIVFRELAAGAGYVGMLRIYEV
jgi:hypothetical protein